MPRGSLAPTGGSSNGTTILFLCQSHCFHPCAVPTPRLPPTHTPLVQHGARAPRLPCVQTGRTKRSSIGIWACQLYPLRTRWRALQHISGAALAFQQLSGQERTRAPEVDWKQQRRTWRHSIEGCECTFSRARSAWCGDLRFGHRSRSRACVVLLACGIRETRRVRIEWRIQVISYHSAFQKSISQMYHGRHQRLVCRGVGGICGGGSR